MQKLRALWKKDPGLFVSGCAHLLALFFLVANFSRAPDFSDQVESVPVEMITDSQFNEISNGEKTAQPMPKPQRRIDKLAEVEDPKPTPPLAEAKKDTPMPAAPEKANDDPGDDDKPTEKSSAATLPVPTPPVPTPPVPTPPERPVEKAETPQPPPKPDDVKPPPPDAEALEQKPPPKPKPEPKHEPKKVAKVVPPVPPRRPEKTEPKKETLDQVAQLLDKLKPPKPAVKQRSGTDTKDAKPSTFSVDKISALLDHAAPQRKASSGRQLTQLASLGSPTAHAEKLSPSMMAQIDGWLIDHYRGCWSYFGLGATQDYVPRVHVRMAPDGSLIGEPALLNPPSDPKEMS